jgi:hypothetical protein
MARVEKDTMQSEEPPVKTVVTPPTPPKDTERQLSKRRSSTQKKWKTLMLFWPNWGFVHQATPINIKQMVSCDCCVYMCVFLHYIIVLPMIPE